MSPFLRPVSWAYQQIIEIRNRLYDRGVLKSYSLGAKTISIGNLTTGGTGKTPLVAYVAELLAGGGEKVCILSRGYGRRDPSSRVLVSNWEEVIADAAQAGDEPFELAIRLLGKAIVVSDANRVAAASWARETFGITAFVLDDAFQHRRAKRDLDIVCIDSTNPFGEAKRTTTILREPFDNVSRANAIVLTRRDLVSNVSDIESAIRDSNQSAPIFHASTQHLSPRRLEDFLGVGDEDGRGVGNDPVLAFCGLGNPAVFFESLSRAGYEIAATHPFRDHHRYSQADIDSLEQQARQHSARALVTTAKDAGKLDGLRFEIPCYVVEIETVIDDPARFRDLVLSV